VAPELKNPTPGSKRSVMAEGKALPDPQALAAHSRSREPPPGSKKPLGEAAPPRSAFRPPLGCLQKADQVGRGIKQGEGSGQRRDPFPRRPNPLLAAKKTPPKLACDRLSISPWETSQI